MDTNLKTIQINGVSLLYATRDGVTTFTCVPTSKEIEVKQHRLFKNDWDLYRYVDPATQLAISGDGLQRDFSAGYTLFNSDTAFSLRMVDQKIEDSKTDITIKTYFENSNGLKVVQVINQIKPFQGFSMYFEVINEGKETIELEKLSSFMIGALSPFHDKNENDSILIHEIKNYWSTEGRLKTKSLTDLEFEDSWVSLGLKVEKIGVTGMMASRSCIPFIAVEDTKSNVTWAVQLEAIGSWQIEAIHKFGSVSINGGLADFNFGHWRKTLKQGESFKSTKAYISCVEGNLTKACATLTRYHDTLLNPPKTEEDLPIIYNEYLCTWGKPTYERFVTLIPAARQLGCEYFVADAGWYSTGKKNWTSIGDWNTDKNDFPNELISFKELATANGIKCCGIWYEFEGVTDTSYLFDDHPEWILTLNGKKLKREDRYLLDFRKPEVIEYLTEKVIKKCEDNKLDYIKVDYNEDVGIGVDGAESIGEGLRQHAEGVQAFFKKIRKELPDLNLESCSSGGMRHALNFDNIGSMTSFSDSHECLAGATLAIDAHRYMQPRVEQIWISLLPAHSINETYFHLIKGMLGRMCYSGPIDKIGEEKTKLAIEASSFYQDIKHIIKDGETILIDTKETKSILNPQGVNKLIRQSKDGNELVVYVFSYGVPTREIELPVKGYKLIKSFGNCKLKNSSVLELLDKEIAAEVLYFKKN